MSKKYCTKFKKIFCILLLNKACCYCGQDCDHIATGFFLFAKPLDFYKKGYVCKLWKLKNKQRRDKYKHFLREMHLQM